VIGSGEHGERPNPGESGLPARLGLQELVAVIESRARCLYVAERPVDLTKLEEPNTIFVLKLPEGFSTAAGSRGGLGERRVLCLLEFVCGQGDCKKVYESEGEEVTERLDLPYHAAAFPITLPDGKERLVSGVSDPEFVAAYRRVIA
jgi:hypothetical protein